MYKLLYSKIEETIRFSKSFSHLEMQWGGLSGVVEFLIESINKINDTTQVQSTNNKTNPMMSMKPIKTSYVRDVIWYSNHKMNNLNMIKFAKNNIFK